MTKHFRFAMLVLVILMLGSMTTAHAEVIPPEGEGQIGLPAVVLCGELTMRQEPSASSKAVKTLKYGARPNVMKQSNGWAYCADGDSEDAAVGWVNADYLFIDPAWYRTGAKTAVYAWNDTAAPKVALLDKDTTLPILKEEGKWLLVSLRGAVGWICNGAAE